MAETAHGIDRDLISGYLDGELTQAEAQRVRVHLEDCDECRRTADDLTRSREVIMGSEFRAPQDTSWDEAPRTRTSRWLRNAGIVIGLAWLVGIVVFVLVELANEQDLVALLLIGGLVLAVGLLLTSVLIDRRADLENDRYRRVKK